MKFPSSIDRYIARLIFVPLVATLLLAALLLILDKMLSLFEFVAEKGGPVSVVWRMLANLIPEYLALGIPIGLTLGTLLAFRRLALNSELDILRGVGIGYGRLLAVPYVYAGALALLNLAIVGYVQPYARYAYEGLRYDLRTGALGASIKVGEFTTLGTRMTLRVEDAQNSGRDLYGIFVNTRTADGKTLAVTADRGTFLASDDPNTIILRLGNGVLVHDAPEFPAPRVLNFRSHDLPIDLPKMEAFRQRGGGDREYTMPELARVARLSATPLKTRYELVANLNFRLVEVATLFLVPLLALALAVPPKRSSSALGVFLSLVLLVTQHKINQYAEALGGRGNVSPVLALWIPYVLFGALCWWMYRTLAYVPGGQPIGALERVADRIGAVVRRRFAAWRNRAARKPIAA